MTEEVVRIDGAVAAALWAFQYVARFEGWPYVRFAASVEKTEGETLVTFTVPLKHSLDDKPVVFVCHLEEREDELRTTKVESLYTGVTYDLSKGPLDTGQTL